MSDTNTTTSSHASNVIVEGLAETMSKAEMVEQLKALEAAKANQDREARQFAIRVRKLELLASGEYHEKLNPRSRHNPQVIPESLRKAFPGEEINGKPAKGWVVTIECETCGEEREINTQDAFQTRYCEAHKAEAAKAKAKARRTAKKDEALNAMDAEELAAKIASLQSQLGC